MCFIVPNKAAAAPAAAADIVDGEQHLTLSPFAFSPTTAPKKMPVVADDDGQQYYWTAFSSLQAQGPGLMAAKTGTRRPGSVAVRSVWAHNLEEEFALISSLLPRFRCAAVDTEFPGTVYRPTVPAYALTPEKRHALLKANVDALHLIQLGLTLFDSSGRLPQLQNRTKTQYAVWEFNFREFDVRRDRHAPESIALLRAKGVDLQRTREEGLDAAQFGPRLRKLLRAGLGAAGLVTFSGAYDVAYLVKMMLGTGYRLPASPEAFQGVVRAMLRKRLYDVKEMARRCGSAGGDLRGGLDSLAAKLGVPRAVGEAHQAGSDSLLTCQAFIEIKERFFANDDDELATVAGVVAGITAW